MVFPGLAITQDAGIPQLFRQIDIEPRVIICRNEWEVNNQGGHLQGVQMAVYGNVEYAILSGSSSTHAYHSVAELGDHNVIRSINLLMHKPFKHAGGIQVDRNLMVVGIEDNDKKDKSRVCIYELHDPEKPPGKPLAMIEREGEPRRSTAGCCGMTSIGNLCLVVVGDWDTRHLDFYTCDEDRLRKGQAVFEKAFTIDAEKMDRSGWTDKQWHAYQNINLLKDTDGKLYLFGFGLDDQDANVADLFVVEHHELKEFSLNKLLSKAFKCQGGADFGSGAGIYRQGDGRLKVISCGSQIKDSVVLNLFD